MIHTEIHFVLYPENTDTCFFPVTIGMIVLLLQVMCPLHQKEEKIHSDHLRIQHQSILFT